MSRWVTPAIVNAVKMMNTSSHQTRAPTGRDTFKYLPGPYAVEPDE